jgi:hypothetical protein
MAAATTQVIGLPELEAAMARNLAAVQQAMREEFAAAGLEMQTTARQLLTDQKAVDMGALRAATRYRAASEGKAAEVYAPNPVAFAVEHGTEPAGVGGAKQHMPPVKPLEEWAHRHGMDGAGYLIARHIARYGVKARPFLLPAMQQEAPKLQRALAARLRTIIARGGL